MLFCGDIALPFRDAIKIEALPDELARKSWVGNLEGSLIDCNLPQYADVLTRSRVFNNVEAVQQLCEQVNFVGFNLANNHVIDVAPLAESLPMVEDLPKKHLGAGRNAAEAAQELCLSDESGNYVMAAFGWDGISCIYAEADKEGVNPYTRNNVLQTAERLLAAYADRRVVLLFHWNYELERIPQPLDRELAHRLIDMGVYAVIGCHAHRIQPIELYKGHPIVYGLGNFAFRQYTYMNGRSRFPELAGDEMVFEIEKDGKFRVHLLHYDHQTHVLRYIGEQPPECADFSDFDEQAYKTYFKANRVQRKLLPIFYYSDSEWKYERKIGFIKQRQKLVNALAKNVKLKNAIKGLISKKRGGSKSTAPKG